MVSYANFFFTVYSAFNSDSLRESYKIALRAIEAGDGVATSREWRPVEAPATRRCVCEGGACLMVRSETHVFKNTPMVFACT
jgi:hypothetical protein